MNYLKVIDRAVRSAYVAKRSYNQQFIQNREESIRLYNWWNGPNNRWLYEFIKSHRIVPNDEVLNLMSVYGYRNVSKHLKSDGKLVFYTMENSHDIPLDYADYLMSDIKPDLALGFDIFEQHNYMRFPLWIMYMFKPNSTDDEIRKRCAELRYPNIANKNKFASLVARIDWSGTRSCIYHALEHIGTISCPSAVLHNDDTLKTQYGDNKEAYIKQFVFNICPENTNNMGYVTEKAFEAISAGCVPVYWGSFNQPEPLVLNHDAMILWNMDGNNNSEIRMIEELMSNPQLLNEFIRQPRILGTAEEYILDTIHELENRLRRIYD